MFRRVVAVGILLHFMIVATTLAESGSVGRALAQAGGAVAVEEPISVVSNSFEHAGGIGYDTVVVFSVRNSSSTQAAVNVPYRVSVEAEGGNVFVSDGQDTITIYPMETRLVAYRALGSTPIEMLPDRAVVQVYPSSSMMRAAQPSSQNSWSLTGYHVRCPEVVIECEVIGDLVWSGPGTKRPVLVAVVVRQGDDGPMIGAGTSQVNVGVMDSGQAAPIRVSLRGFDQPSPARAPVLPEGPFSVQIYVEAVQ
jgi:hypothetical protein